MTNFCNNCPFFWQTIRKILITFSISEELISDVKHTVAAPIDGLHQNFCLFMCNMLYNKTCKIISFILTRNRFLQKFYFFRVFTLSWQQSPHPHTSCRSHAHRQVHQPSALFHQAHSGSGTLGNRRTICSSVNYSMTCLVWPNLSKNCFWLICLFNFQRFSKDGIFINKNVIHSFLKGKMSIFYIDGD